jgi:hypothetical protein
MSMVRLAGPFGKGVVLTGAFSAVGAYGLATYVDPADPKVDEPHPAMVISVSSTATFDTGVAVFMPNTIEGEDFRIEAPAFDASGFHKDT